MTLNERKEYSLMAYVILSCSLRWDAGQSYGFWRALVIHVRANMKYFEPEGSENIVSYMDDSNAKSGRLLLEQGYFKEAETFGNKVLDTRNRLLGVEHLDTIKAMEHLGKTYYNLGKYSEAEKLQMQVLDTSKTIFGVEHPDIVRSMANLAATYSFMKRYTEAEKLDISVMDACKRILGVEHPDTIRSMANLASTYRGLGKYREAEKLEIPVLGNVTGYPGVFQSNPHPYPSKPVPASMGTGFHGHGSRVYKNPRVPQPA